MIRGLVSGLAVVAAAALIATSGTMNYLFMRSLGRTALEGELLGTVSVAGDVMKALLPILLGFAMQARRRVYLCLGCTLFGICSIVSFTSCLGFMATNREAADATTLEAQRRAKNMKDVEEQLRSLPPYRPLTVLDEELNAMRTDRRWRSSKGCDEINASSSRVHCERYFKLRSERGWAEQAARLEERINLARKQLDAIGVGVGAREAHAQVRTIAHVLGVEATAARGFVLMLITVLVELGSAIGLFIATSHGPGESGLRRNLFPIPRGLGRKVLLQPPLERCEK